MEDGITKYLTRGDQEAGSGVEGHTEAYGLDDQSLIRTGLLRTRGMGYGKLNS
jgi:hypothetical protein